MPPVLLLLLLLLFFSIVCHMFGDGCPTTQIVKTISTAVPTMKPTAPLKKQNLNWQFFIFIA
jgi:hypothetical protein